MSHWDTFFHSYPINREMIWLNNCGTTPIGERILNTVHDSLLEYSKQGVLNQKYSFAKVRGKILDILSRLLNCEPMELALVHNTSEGMNFVSHGLNLKSNDEILLMENEYPSNVYPWEHWKEKGVKINFIPMSFSPSEYLKNVQEKITPKTRLLSVSAVHWCTGVLLPLKEIGQICKNNNTIFVVDASQGIGLVSIDVKKCNIQYLASAAWKWLLGPLGLGILYVQKEYLDQTKVIFKGQNTVVNAEEYLPYKDKIKQSADKFECSTQNYFDWIYFMESLSMLDEVGFDKVMNRIYELTNYAGEQFKKLNFSINLDKLEKNNTGILVVEKEGIDSVEIFNLLKENQIITALRLNRIRISPHIYNSKAQIDQLASVIQAKVK